MAKVKLYGHIWGPELNRYVFFLLRGNWTIFGWDIANYIFDLHNLYQKWKKSKKLSKSYRVDRSLQPAARAAAAAYEPVQKHKFW